MTASREAITQALLAKITASGAFTTVARRMRGEESIPVTQTPALFLRNSSETAVGAVPTLTKTTLHLMALIYTNINASETIIPDSVLNPLLDSLQATFKADDPSGRFTLGGLVYSVKARIGETKKGQDDVTGQSVAIIPIEVLIP